MQFSNTLIKDLIHQLRIAILKTKEPDDMGTKYTKSDLTELQGAFDKSFIRRVTLNTPAWGI